MMMNDTELESDKCDEKKVSDCDENWKLKIKRSSNETSEWMMENVSVTCGKL